MTIAEWLAASKADADQRGLGELIPLLDGLARSTERLRAADWNDQADQATPRDPSDPVESDRSGVALDKHR